MSFFSNIFGNKEKEDLNKGLEKTKTSFFNSLSKMVAGRSTVDEEVLDELESLLISADVGRATSTQIIERIDNMLQKEKGGIKIGQKKVNPSSAKKPLLKGLGMIDRHSTWF